MFPSSYSFSLYFLIYFSYEITPSNFNILKFQRYYSTTGALVSPLIMLDLPCLWLPVSDNFDSIYPFLLYKKNL